MAGRTGEVAKMPTVVVGPFVNESYAAGLQELLEDVHGSELVRIDSVEALVAWVDIEPSPSPVVFVLDSRLSDSLSPEIQQLHSATVVLLDSAGAHAQICVDNPSGDRFVRIVRSLVDDWDSRSELDAFSRRTDEGAAGDSRSGALRGRLEIVEEWLALLLGHQLLRLKARQSATSVPGWYVSPDSALSALGFTEDDANRLDLAERLAVADRDLVVERHRLPEALASIAARFRLSDNELRLLLLALAPEIDGRYGLSFGVLCDDLTRRRPNLTVAARLLEDSLSAWALLSELSRRSSVFENGLLDFARSAAAHDMPGSDVGIRPASPLVDYLLGGPDAVARNGGRLVPAGEQRLTSTEGRLASLLQSLRAGSTGTDPVLNPVGHDLSWFERTVSSNGLPLVVGDLSGVDGGDECRKQLRAWILLAKLQAAGLLLVGVDALSLVDKHRVGRELVAARAGLPLLAIEAGELAEASGGLPTLRLEAPTTTMRERTAMWSDAAAPAGVALTENDARHLAGTLPLNLDEIDECLAVCLRSDVPGDSERPLLRQIQAARRQLDTTPLPAAVQRVATELGWDDIVVAPAAMEQLRTITTHHRNAGQVMEEWGFQGRVPYGHGLGALFSGPSGTGKTMAARIIASELGVELLQVDLAKTVSKYIGETEKNLDAAFTAAQRIGAVLLFDEADALFGKRTEVKDSHDRHANVEVAYLLQRIESFPGVAILTTNLKQNIDDSFLRRLRFSVDFAIPNAEQRELIWRKAFPDSAPLADDLDLTFLARRLKLTGGSIQQIALHAAFAAADQVTSIGSNHVVTAARQELLKIGMLNTEKALEELAA